MQHNEPPKNAFFAKLPKVKESSIKKKWILSSKHIGKFVLDNRTTFYILSNFIHNKHEGGSDGYITPGYSSRGARVERYVAKVTKISNTAQHEAKYHQMLGRQAFWFTWEGAEVLLAEWQHGLPLNFLFSDHFIPLTYVDRLQCIIHCLTELDIFHSHGRAHLDIAERNLILDIKNMKLRLIDFGSSTKASPETMLTDIDRLSSCLQNMFPEIYHRSYRSVKPLLTIMEKGIELLIQRMSRKHNWSALDNYDEPCSAKQALQFCQALVDNHQELNDELLQKITMEVGWVSALRVTQHSLT